MAIVLATASSSASNARRKGFPLVLALAMAASQNPPSETVENDKPTEVEPKILETVEKPIAKVEPVYETFEDPDVVVDLRPKEQETKEEARKRRHNLFSSRGYF